MIVIENQKWTSGYSQKLYTLKLISVFISVIIILSSSSIAIAMSKSQSHVESQTPEQDSMTEPNLIFTSELIETNNINSEPANEYCIIQFTGPIQQAWKDLVTHYGVVLFDYLPEFAFMARLNTEIKAQITTLPFVKYIEPISPEYKYSVDTLVNYMASTKPFITDFRVQFFNNRENPTKNIGIKENALHSIINLGAEILTISETKVDIRIQSNLLENVASIPEVQWLTPVPEFRYMNDVATGIIEAATARENLSLDGTGQVVTVCDTGLDNGSIVNIHEDFRGRVLHAYSLGRMNDWSDDDIHDPFGFGAGGHGTHVAGSVLGAGNHSNGQYRGIAYNATLVIQSTMMNNGGLYVPSNLNNLFSPPYNTYNSRIHTNSWGSENNPGKYVDSSQEVDEFIWDHKDQVILFAAGNYEFSPQKVYSPGTAKNCITVGASESLRSAAELPSYYQQCNNIDQRASFSCYGTDDNRIKPDIVAPGTGILSTRSSKIPDPDNHYWQGFNDYYAYAGGTSMSTPIAAGTVTIIRQYYTDLEGIEPSAALVKATLINGARDMRPSGGTPTIPNILEGWGRIDLKNSIYPNLPSNLIYVDNETGLTTGKNYSFTIDLINNSHPLNITMVWSDYPASTSASSALVNDLHLNVTHVDSDESFKGNVFKNGWSSSDDADANPNWDTSVPKDGYDNRNNVEGVRLESPKIGRYRITVVGNNVPNGPQPFAFAITGGLNPISLLPPANLKIESVPTGNALNVTWEPVFNPTVIGYEIYRSLTPTTGFELINTTNSNKVKKYHDGNLVDGTTYYYKLRSKNLYNNLSNFTIVVPGIPHDSVPPWIIISSPTNNTEYNKNITIHYTNETDCEKIVFRYYLDSNGNGLPDDGNNWELIGTDTTITGTFWWNTSESVLNMAENEIIIFSAEGFDEVPNSKIEIITNIWIDNKPPEKPILNLYSPNPSNKRSVKLTGIAETYCSIQIFSNGNLLGTTLVGTTEDFEITVNLVEGLNTVTARALDKLGNGPGPSSNPQDIIVDTIAPVADADGNFTMLEDSWIVFNASNSFDTVTVPGANYIISYIWTFELKNGTPVELSGMEASYYFETMGNYTINLTVEDNAHNFGSQLFWVRVNDDTKPVANAGGNITVDEDTQLFFNANGSTDNDPMFNITGSFQWSFNDYNESQLELGKTELVKLYGINSSYTFKTPGMFEIFLKVTDSAGNSDTDSITVTIRDTEPPTAKAAADKIVVTVGRYVTFNAGESIDNDPTFPTTGNFTWYISLLDETLYGMTARFRFNATNQLTDVYNIRLTVQDKTGNNDIAEMHIRVESDLIPPKVLWTVPMDNGLNVRVTTIIKIKLSETLDTDAIPVNLSTFQLLDGFYNPMDGELRYDPSQDMIIFIPNEILNFGESYSVLLQNSLVDLAGNTLDGNGNGRIDESEKLDIFKLVFTTANITKNPQNFQPDVPLDSEINIKFSGNISEFTVKNIELNLINMRTETTIPGEMTFDLPNLLIIFKPDKTLAGNTEYKVNITLKFLLLPIDELEGVAVHREVLATEINNGNSNGNSSEEFNVSSGNITKKKLSWTFTTEKKLDEGSEFLDMLMDSIILFCGLIILILVIIIVVFIVIFRKRRRMATAEDDDSLEGEEDFEFDEDYEEEYERVYGELPGEAKDRKRSRRGRGRRRQTPRPARALAKERAQRTGKKKGKQKDRAKAKAKKSRKSRAPPEEELELEEDWYEHEDEVESDVEAEDFDFEEEYITDFEEGEAEVVFELEDEEELEELEELEDDEEPEELEELEELEE
jgi:subtilisin family serine protease